MEVLRAVEGNWGSWIQNCMTHELEVRSLIPPVRFVRLHRWALTEASLVLCNRRGSLGVEWLAHVRLM